MKDGTHLSIHAIAETKPKFALNKAQYNGGVRSCAPYRLVRVCMSTRTGLSTGVHQCLRTTKSVYLGTVRYELLPEYRYVT
eukprot:scaffold647694_cov38-Prasinocladus_malaysianus.AAC.1